MRKSLLSLLLVVFIDAAGMGILFPVLNSIIMDPSVNFLNAETSLSMRYFYYGIVLAVFFIFWFLGATFVSRTSDSIGRKKALMICLYGLFLGYVLTILAIDFKSIGLLILGRIIAGATAGSQPVAQAAIVDLSIDENKTKNLGLIMFAFAFGMIFGPVIGGIFSDKTIYSGFSYALPFYIILVVIILDILLVGFCFIDQYKNHKPFKFKISEVITQFEPAIKLANVRELSIVFFIMQIAFNTFYIFIPVYLLQKYGFATFGVSTMLLITGLAMAFSNIFLVGKFARIFSNKKTVMVGILGMLVSLLMILLINSWIIPFIFAVPFMIFFGLAYTNMLALFSNSVDESMQGWVMGITVSLFTLGCAIISFIGGELMTISVNLPFIVAAICFVIAFLLFLVFKKATITYKK